MLYNYADWFVGAVAIVLGLAMLWNALSPSDRTFELPKLRWLERSYGRNTARLVLGTLAALLIALGVAIAAGWKLHWEEAQSSRPLVSDNSSA